jgi:hypothetical protein
MSSTRFHDDPCRIQKQLQEQTGLGRYMLNVPGNGDKPCFMEDPHIRMQKWGANLMTNPRNLESDLMGLTRASSRDCASENNYKTQAVTTSKINYPSCDSTITDQSRATHPAWMSRDLEQVNWSILPLNPQENTCMRFQNNLSTRLLEKNAYVAEVPCLTPFSPSETVNYNPFVKPMGTTF